MADEGGENAAPQDSSGEKYTIPRFQVKPGKLLTCPKDRLYSTRLPTIPNKTSEYTPMPYTFRVPTINAPVKISNILARSPPFYVLLDHTIAVIWLIFGSKEYDSPLGIVQLQWALAFLKTIQTKRGSYPTDVEVCINAIEELLLKQYAELSEEMSNVERLDDSVKYAEGAFGTSTMITQAFPFSINYEEIAEKVELADVHDVRSITSVEAEEQLEKLKKEAGVGSIIKLEAGQKDKAIGILKMWKADQLEKVKEGLKRVRSIEDRIKDIDENFNAFIEDDMEELLQ